MTVSVHNPDQYMASLRQIIAQGRKRIGLLVGAGAPVRGFPTLIVTILLLGGMQLMATGILGEYMGRLFMESKRRPLYLIDDYRPATLSALQTTSDKLG